MQSGKKNNQFATFTFQSWFNLIKYSWFIVDINFVVIF